ncbi:MAG: L-2,4-diaminobutyrate decarboxylase [Sphingobacteriales bacterium]|jgi:L-2,4-diaminobutyrate decarboxylase
MLNSFPSLEKAYDVDAFKEQGHLLVDLLASQLSKTKAGKGRVKPDATPEHLYETLDLSKTPADFKELTELIISQSTTLHHPGFGGHQVVPPAPLAVLGDFLSAYLNNGMAVYEMGPAANAMEKVVMDWLCKKLGYGASAEGIFTSGGSLGNITALLAARQVMVKDSWNAGTADKQLAVMVSEEAHYSVARAVKIMGFGEGGVIPIPTVKHKINPKALKETLEKAKADGKHVFAVVGNACSTSLGVYDDLNALADFCESENLWFHIDGAHGAPAAFSKEFSYLTSGIDRADSLVIDFHKMMLTPALTTGVVFAKGGDSYATFAQKAAYLLNPDGHEWYNSGNRTVECTKKMMAAKVYLMLKLLGEDVFEEYVTRQYQLARLFAQKVKAHDCFELGMEPESNIVCFRFKTRDSVKDWSNINSQIRDMLMDKGDFYIVQTLIGESLYLRTTLMSPFTTENHLDAMLGQLKTIGESLVSA